MIVFPGKLDKKILSKFESGYGMTEYFMYVGNLLTVENAISLYGMFYPDFVEVEDHIFWSSDADHDRKNNRFDLFGLKNDASGRCIKSMERMDVERFKNNFPLINFFAKWDNKNFDKYNFYDLSDNECELLYIFASILKDCWGSRLREIFPKKKFIFEINDDILDEYGLCITFYQSSSS